MAFIPAAIGLASAIGGVGGVAAGAGMIAGAVAPTVMAVGAGYAASQYMGKNSMGNNMKGLLSQAVGMANAQNQPNPNDSLLKAQEAANAKRRASLLAGGNTDITGGKAFLSPNSTKQKTLLGQ